MTLSLLAPFIVFGVIVLVHEGGHFLTAKWTGMKVEEFAIGFGPRLFSFKKGETVYSLRLFPLGGFNRIMGMDPPLPGERRDPRAFSERPVWQKLLVISAGSLTNIVMAFLIFCSVFWVMGVQSFPDRPEIGRVIPGMPAEMAGLLPGDRILSVDGKAIGKWTDLRGVWGNKPGRILPMTIERDGVTKEVTIIPRDNGEGQALVGVTAALDSRPISAAEAVRLGAGESLAVVQSVFLGIASAVTGGQAEVSGPIGVARMAGVVAEVGPAQFFLFIAILSLNLGIMNLFPVPLLDGGLFFLILGEALFRRRLSGRVLHYIQAVGITILLALFIFATMNDISALMK